MQTMNLKLVALVISVLFTEGNLAHGDVTVVDGTISTETQTSVADGSAEYDGSFTCYCRQAGGNRCLTPWVCTEADNDRRSGPTCGDPNPALTTDRNLNGFACLYYVQDQTFCPCNPANNTAQGTWDCTPSPRPQ